MAEVKRYDMAGYEYDPVYMEESKRGDYVEYDDYAKLEAENARLRAELAVTKAQYDELAKLRA